MSIGILEKCLTSEIQKKSKIYNIAKQKLSVLKINET